MALHAGYKIVDCRFEIWKAPLFFFFFSDQMGEILFSFLAFPLG